MLEYSPWKIEQHAFEPQSEVTTDEQLAFSNGYISQYAFFEEQYSGARKVGTFVESIMRADNSQPLEIPNPTNISLRLGDERLDLNHWQVESFYRCLHKGETCLERQFTATSPHGYTIEVSSLRCLNVKNPHFLNLTYSVRFVNYEGIISFMTLIGGSTHVVDWYPLQTSIDDEVAYMWLQAADSDTQLCAAQGHSLLKNGQEQTERPIKIDKKNVLGFAYMTDVRPNDLFTMQTRVAIVDSRRFAKSELTKRAIEKLANHD